MAISTKQTERHAMFLATAGPAYVNAAQPIWERRGLLGRLVRVGSPISNAAVEPREPIAKAA